MSWFDRMVIAAAVVLFAALNLVLLRVDRCPYRHVFPRRVLSLRRLALGDHQTFPVSFRPASCYQVR